MINVRNRKKDVGFVVNKSRELIMCEQSYVREKLNALLDTGVPRKKIMAAIGLHAANLSRFLSGRQDMSEENINALYSKEIIQKPDEYQIKGIKNKPLEVWYGDIKTIQSAAKEKGRSDATIRKWCKEGKLNYYRRGRRYFVAVDDKYNAISVSEKAQMRNRIEELEARNAQLEAQVERMQLNFSFDTDAQERAEENDSRENESLKDELLTKKLEVDGWKYEVEDLRKENEQLKSAIEAYQNTITRLTSQNAKDSSQNSFSREKMTSNSFMLCGA